MAEQLLTDTTTLRRSPLAHLAQQMREQSVQLAVVEESGAFRGVVTLTDVVKRVLPGARTEDR